MSRNLARVRAALTAAGVVVEPVEMPADIRAAGQAAAGCALDASVKSIRFQGGSGRLCLFLTAGGNQVDAARATAFAGKPLCPANADTVRAVTGYGIGGMAPLGHLTALPLRFDPRLTVFPLVCAVAGTPRQILAIAPADLARNTGVMAADFCA